MFGFSRIVFGGFIAAVLFAPAAAEAKIRLRLSYNQQLTLAVASVASEGEMDFLIDGQNVDVYAMSSGGGTLVATRAGGSGYYFGPAVFRIGFARNVIDMSATYASHVVRAHVATDGRSSCRASVSSTLRPGHSAYEYELPVYGSINVYKVRFANVRCELSNY